LRCLIIYLVFFLICLIYFDNWRALSTHPLPLFIDHSNIFTGTPPTITFLLPKVDEVLAGGLQHDKVESAVAHCDTLGNVLFYKD
jgi:hypothetical protein